MNVQSQTKISSGTGSHAAEIACRQAKELEKLGDFEGAREALSDFWDPLTNTLAVGQLQGIERAEVLHRVGSVASRGAAASPQEGAQESAKDFISQAIRIYEELNLHHNAAEARADLALCYWREGAFDEARINLNNALREISDDDQDLKALILIRAGIVEGDARRLSDALRIYGEASDLVEKSGDHYLQGTFHFSLGLTLRRMADGDNLETYVDRALIEYAAASFHFEQAGNKRYFANVENNLGFLLYSIGRYQEAHAHLDRARQLYTELKDSYSVAHTDETRARTFLASGRLPDAERTIRSAVRVLERGDGKSVLAEALTTYGMVKARMGKFVRARQLMDRAIEISETCGDLEGAGRAKLSIIEELTSLMPPSELVATYEAAIELLRKSQDPATTSRLILAGRTVINALQGNEAESQPAVSESWDNFSLKREVRAFEKSLIERSLRDAGGAVTKAAHLLGFKHHQSLISLINSRHRDLLMQRSAVRPRRSHLFSKPRKAKALPENKSRTAPHIRILQVEDDAAFAEQTRQLLAAEKWRVESCADGDNALKKLTDSDHYDVLIVESNLTGLSGLELTRRARKITHRRRTPILVLSADELETKSLEAGADAFLKKPEQLGNLSTTVARLLREGSKHR